MGNRELRKPTWQDTEMDLAAKGSGCGSVADTGRDICGVVTGTVRASDHRMGGTASSESVTRHVADTSLKG